jgi:hypothetical protein
MDLSKARTHGADDDNHVLSRELRGFRRDLVLSTIFIVFSKDLKPLLFVKKTLSILLSRC